MTFKENVYKIASGIPAGKVMTYGGLAQRAGNTHAARAVGMLMSHNADPSVVPCHRVVASTGKLTGYAFGNGVSTKEKKLRAEGVVFKKKGKESYVDLTASLWSGSFA